MSHLPFIAGAYGIAVLLAAGLAVQAALRLGRARRRLAAIDPRGRGGDAR